MAFFRQSRRLIHAKEEQIMTVKRHKNHLSLRIVFVPLALLLGVMFTNIALAEDGKEYPGSMCKEGVDGHHVKRATGDIVFTAEGAAQNLSKTGFRYVSCPLVRDAERSTGNITYAAVTITKADSTGVMCQLYSKPYFGGAGWVTTKWDFSGAGLRLIELPVQADAFTSGSFNLLCVLPQMASGKKFVLHHYGIVEDE
jgi:hypothetical protein